MIRTNAAIRTNTAIKHRCCPALLRTMAGGFLLGLWTSPATAAPRDIQFRSVDFTSNVLELFNFGQSNEDLSGWRFCSHDENQSLRYSSSSGLNGVTLAPEASLFLHFQNDAPAVPNALNIASLGSFSTPLDRGPYAIQVYFPPVSFGNGNRIADSIQWSIGGTHNNRADERSDEAQNGGVWTDRTAWIPTTSETLRLELTDTTGGVLHGPDDYTAIEPPQSLPGDFDQDGDIDGRDFLAWQANFGTRQGATTAGGDTDGDGDVDGQDVGAWQANFGTAGPAPPAVRGVPEPHTALLCLILVAAMRLCRGRG